MSVMPGVRCVMPGMHCVMPGPDRASRAEED